MDCGLVAMVMVKLGLSTVAIVWFTQEVKMKNSKVNVHTSWMRHDSVYILCRSVIN